MIVVEGGRENVTTLNIYAPKGRVSGETSTVVQGLRLHTPNVGGPGLIPG